MLNDVLKKKKNYWVTVPPLSLSIPMSDDTTFFGCFLIRSFVPNWMCSEADQH